MMAGTSREKQISIEYDVTRNSAKKKEKRKRRLEGGKQIDRREGELAEEERRLGKRRMTRW